MTLASNALTSFAGRWQSRLTAANAFIVAGPSGPRKINLIGCFQNVVSLGFQKRVARFHRPFLFLLVEGAGESSIRFCRISTFFDFAKRMARVSRMIVRVMRCLPIPHHQNRSGKQRGQATDLWKRKKACSEYRYCPAQMFLAFVKKPLNRSCPILFGKLQSLHSITLFEGCFFEW